MWTDQPCQVHFAALDEAYDNPHALIVLQDAFQHISRLYSLFPGRMYRLMSMGVIAATEPPLLCRVKPPVLSGRRLGWLHVAWPKMRIRLTINV